ncbi:hypothetical protein [Streptomyces rishiriensis]|uniref:2'-5' RNA ligase family protein n=1 Tax=Streptomyces rishiriensis TaxID=68264 RepID=A0ABU0NPC0_STRRH|nr:hypothetical protein [Streptomyces rishiriensis]MDQ0580985.1 hypothetical protein [Streptomyces rishiriensis]
MRRVRPGVAAARGSTGETGSAVPRTAGPAPSRAVAPAHSRAPGEERALTSVAAGERYLAQEGAESKGGQPLDVPRLWHVTLSVSGEEAPLKEVRRALEQLAHDHPFLLTSRYAGDHAEIRYWEEARDLHDAAAVALRLWGEHRQTAGLPPWEIVGLEVIDRQTYHQRIAEGYGPAPATPVGVHPY